MKKRNITWGILFFAMVALGIYGNYERDKKEQDNLLKEQLLEDATNLEGYLEELSYYDDEVPYIEVYTIGISPDCANNLSVYVRLYDKFDTYSEDKKTVVIHQCNTKLKGLLFTEISNSDYIFKEGYNDWYFTFYYDTNSVEYSEYTYSLISNSWELQEYNNED